MILRSLLLLVTPAIRFGIDESIGPDLLTPSLGRSER